MRQLILSLSFAATSLGGCVGGEVAYSATAAYEPDLVYVAPGVSVIADYDEPVFYTDNFYWRFYGGTWYRSPWYDRGWIYATPPSVIARIDRPYGYRYYWPQGYVARRDHRHHDQGHPRPVDHRGPGGHQPSGGNQPPTVRDHRR